MPFVGQEYEGDPTATQAPSPTPAWGAKPKVLLPLSTDDFSASAFWQQLKAAFDNLAFILTMGSGTISDTYALVLPIELTSGKYFRIYRTADVVVFTVNALWQNIGAGFKWYQDLSEDSLWVSFTTGGVSVYHHLSADGANWANAFANPGGTAWQAGLDESLTRLLVTTKVTSTGDVESTDGDLIADGDVTAGGDVDAGGELITGESAGNPASLPMDTLELGHLRKELCPFGVATVDATGDLQSGANVKSCTRNGSGDFTIVFNGLPPLGGSGGAGANVSVRAIPGATTHWTTSWDVSTAGSDLQVDVYIKRLTVVAGGGPGGSDAVTLATDDQEFTVWVVGR